MGGPLDQGTLAVYILGSGLRCSALHYIYKLLIWAGFARSYSLIIDDISYLILLLVPKI